MEVWRNRTKERGHIIEERFEAECGSLDFELNYYCTNPFHIINCFAFDLLKALSRETHVHELPDTEYDVSKRVCVEANAALPECTHLGFGMMQGAVCAGRMAKVVMQQQGWRQKVCFITDLWRGKQTCPTGNFSPIHLLTRKP